MNNVTGWTDNYLRVDLGRRNHVPSAVSQVRVVGLGDEGLIGEPVDWMEPA